MSISNKQLVLLISVLSKIYIFSENHANIEIEYNIPNFMEKIDIKNLRIALPQLQKRKNRLEHNKQNLHQTSSTIRLNSLKKLYCQYKSNARNLHLSPYRSDNQKKQFHQLVSSNILRQASRGFRKSNRKIMKHNQSVDFNANNHEIILRINKKKITIHSKAETFLDLNQQLIKFVHKQQDSQNNKTYSKEPIIGFQTVKEQFVIDYNLASRTQAKLPLNFNFELRPVYYSSISKKICLNDFKFIRCLGSGGFSTVFLVRGNFDMKYYALKLIDKDFILESQRQGIVQNQRFILGQLKSAFVTQLQFCFQTKNHFSFAIEYCQGGELFYQLKRVKKMSEQQAKFYFLEILVGLDYIHKKKIVYRDLKPENLLIAADGHVKIADYGLSKPIETEKALSYSFCGSPEYMAPQMLLKIGHNYTLDYYCLGALLYELVIGIPPYYSTDHNEIYQAILNQQLTFPSHTVLSDQLINLLQGLLEKKSSKRLGSMFGIKEILYHPWIGKMSQKDIQQKKLTPPFKPDPMNFNFDPSQIKELSTTFKMKIAEDMKTKNKFQTHFNQDFSYHNYNNFSIPKPPYEELKKYNSLSKRNKNNRSEKVSILKRNLSHGTLHCKLSSMR